MTIRRRSRPCYSLFVLVTALVLILVGAYVSNEVQVHVVIMYIVIMSKLILGERANVTQ